MQLSRQDILGFLRNPDSSELFALANSIRLKACGEDVLLRAIIEFSNYCSNNCFYCGLRVDNKSATRFRLPIKDIISSAQTIIENGIDTIVLQSGDDYSYSQKDICAMIESIKNLKSDLAITLSIGERSYQDYQAFKFAGADRYLIKHETANEKLYSQLHPGQTLAQRKNILNSLRKLGYQIGSGFIIGLPGQGVEEITEDLLYLQELQPDMAGISPFLAQSATPLADLPSGSIDLTLKCIAIARITTYNSHLPATTALGSLDPQKGLESGLRAGANVLMCDFTPDFQRSQYKIYDNKLQVTLDAAQNAIAKADRIYKPGRGDSLK